MQDSAFITSATKCTKYGCILHTATTLTFREKGHCHVTSRASVQRFHWEIIYSFM